MSASAAPTMQGKGGLGASVLKHNIGIIVARLLIGCVESCMT